MAALLLLSLAPYLLADGANPMQAMNCQQRTAAELETRIAEESARLPYKPRDYESSFPVTLHFNLEEPSLPSSSMTIESLAAYLKTGNGLLYHGPYRKSISVRIGNELFDQGQHGVDSLSFRFFNRKNHEICVQEQDSSASYWKPNANVHIEFIAHRDIDQRSGPPIGHKVSVK